VTPLVERLHLIADGLDDRMHVIASIREAADRIEALEDSVEGLEADLHNAVQVAYNRGAVEWARLNYRSMIPWLEGQARALTGGEKP